MRRAPPRVSSLPMPDPTHEPDGPAVPRYDAGGYESGGTLNPPTRREDGSVVVEAYATRAGVFPYRQTDGSTVWELRHPDDVFEPASMESLKLRPYTDGHPYDNVARIDGQDFVGLLDASSAQRYTRGVVTEKVWRDGDKLACRVVILDSALGAEVLAGDKAETSCGYKSVTVAESGTYQGQPYQRRQKKIRYNHLAAVEHGRAGPDVRARLDAMDGAMVRPTTPAAPTNEGAPKVKITINGITGDVPEHVAQAYEAKAKLDEAEVAKLKEEATKLRGERDALKTKLDETEKEKTDVKAKLDAALDPKARAAAVRIRAKVERVGLKVLGKSVKLDGKDVPLSDLSDDDIRARVIAKKSPDFKLDSDDAKNPVYLRARFDGIASTIKLDADEPAPTFPPGGDGGMPPDGEDEEPKDEPKADADEPPTTDGQGGEARTDAADPQAVYLKTLREAWKPKAK